LLFLIEALAKALSRPSPYNSLILVLYINDKERQIIENFNQAMEKSKQLNSYMNKPTKLHNNIHHIRYMCMGLKQKILNKRIKKKNAYIR